MNERTVAILGMVDAVFPGGRKAFFNDILPLFGDCIYYRTTDVMARYQVSRATVELWHRQGLLIPSFKMPGGTIRYTLKDLTDFEAKVGKYSKENQNVSEKIDD